MWEEVAGDSDQDLTWLRREGEGGETDSGREVDEEVGDADRGGGFGRGLGEGHGGRPTRQPAVSYHQVGSGLCGVVEWFTLYMQYMTFDRRL